MVEDGKARSMPVTRVHAFGQEAAVTGLQGSEQVITEGKQNLRPGGRIKLADAVAPKARPARQSRRRPNEPVRTVHPAPRDGGAALGQPGAGRDPGLPAYSGRGAAQL
ncbi:hypothetical protein LP419_16405 [Massilia sp. H-1]|nr:hypothetical protein LP419_16405 [Massilia sp. H-1]